MFIAVFFMLQNTRRDSQTSIKQKNRKLGYAHTMKYYPSITKIKQLIYATK